MTDQQQADVIAPDHPCQTPNLQRFAEDGVRFTRAFTPTAHCCPARVTFLTGLYPSRHGVFNNVLGPQAFRTEPFAGVRSFADALGASGYQLAFAGKWHVSRAEAPSDWGFEELLVNAVRDERHSREIGDWLTAKREHVTDVPGPRQRGHVSRPGWGTYRLYGTVADQGLSGYEGWRDWAVTTSAIDAMGRLSRSDDPWFLYVGLVGPHDPYIVPERFARLHDPATVPLPASYDDDLRDKPNIYRRMRNQVWDQLAADEVQEAIAHYWGYCTMLDEMFGAVLDALDATGQADDTLVVYLTDHGDYVGAHGLFLKGVPAFREAYHVPLVVRWPAGARAGMCVNEFVTLADFAPTFLDLGGAPVPDAISGRSIRPLLEGDVPSDWPDAFHSQFNGVELYYTQRAVQTKDYKYVYNGFDFDELYDLRRDPHERVNRTEDATLEPVRADLIDRMWRFALRENDSLASGEYATTSLAPRGPAATLRPDLTEVGAS